MIIASNNEKETYMLYDNVSILFNIKDLGGLSYFLDLKILKQTYAFFVGQQDYMPNLLILV